MRPADRRGSTISRTTVRQLAGPGLPAHTPRPALSDGVLHPTESIRQNYLQMTLHPLQLQPQLSSRIVLPMTDERRLFLNADGKWTLDNESRTDVGQCADAPGSLNPPWEPAPCNSAGSLNKNGPAPRTETIWI